MDGDRISGYDQLTDIGGGGFSRVYRANDLNNFRTVAIKVLNPTNVTEAQRKAFDRERKAMATIGSHPNVVQLLDSDFSDGGRPYIVMPFYENGTFADRVRDGRGIAASEVLDVGVKIASALHVAHGHNIVHRDVKPSNIFQGDFGQHALADFGISSFSAQHTAYTKSAEVALSPSHSAPEVLDDERPSVATDVYMLGSTLYTLLTGQLAFAGESLGAVVRKILSEPPPPIAVDAPNELKALIMSMLAKKPEDRPASARDVAESLHEIQIAAGLPPTRVAVHNDTTPAANIDQADEPTEPFDPDATTVFGRMATVQPAPEKTVEPPITAAQELTPVQGSAVSRLAKPTALLLGVVVLATVVWGFTRSGDNDPIDPSAQLDNPVDPDDALPILPTTPVNIVVTPRPGATGYEITWTAAGGPDTSFELRQVGSADTTTTSETMIVLPLDDATEPCVQMRTVRASRLSEWSDQVCAES